MDKKLVDKLPVILVLVGMAIVGFIVVQKYYFSSTLQSSGLTPFGKVKVLNSQKITIKLNTEALDLVNVSGVWKIGDVEADSEIVKTLLTELSEVQTSQFVSRNPQNFGNFGISPETAYELTLFDGVSTSKIWVGSMSGDSRYFYLRMGDEAKVYLARGLVRDKLSTSSTFWRDKTVVNLDKSTPARIEITGNTYKSFSKVNQDTWGITGIAAVMTPELSQQVTNVFSPLKATSFADADEKTEYDTNFFKRSTITVTDNTGTQVTQISAYKTESGDYLVKVKDNETDVYKVSGSTLDFLFEIGK